MPKEHFSPRVAIAAGFGLELPPLCKIIDGVLQRPIESGVNINLYFGNVDNMTVVLFVSGIGMGRARQSTKEVLDRFPSIEYVIDTGTAGSISTPIPPDIVIPARWEDYSYLIGQNLLDRFLCGRGDSQGFSRSLGVNDDLLKSAASISPDFGSVVAGGVGLSSSKVLIRERHKLLLKERYSTADIVDMESYGVIEACQRKDNPVSAIAIRAVSDTAGRGYGEFLKNFTSSTNRADFQDAKQNYTKFVDALIKKLA